MKILLFDNAGIIKCSGDFCIESKTGAFAKELTELGNEITFFGQKLPEVKNTVHVFKIKENGMEVCGLKRRRYKILSYLLLYLKTIPAIYKTDYVYIFFPNSFKFAAFISRLFCKKYGLYIRGMNDFDNRISKNIYKHASVVFTVSDFFTHYVKKIEKKQLAFTIRPMISFTEKDVISGRQYPKKEIYDILYLGRMDNDKGLKELLYAISEVKERKQNFILTLVGDGENIKELQKLSRELAITPYVCFEGAFYDSETIKKYYLKSDIFILPSFHEGFPRTLYEAMIFGTPIITTFVGGIATLMKDGVNCKKIESRSVKSISDALFDVLDNYHGMGILAQNATKTIYKIVDSRRLSHAQHLDRTFNMVIPPK